MHLDKVTLELFIFVTVDLIVIYDCWDKLQTLMTDACFEIVMIFLLIHFQKACILLLLNDKTDRVWTLAIIYVSCKFIFWYISVYCHFIGRRCGLGLGESDPRQITCYKFWDVVNIIVMLSNFWLNWVTVISITWGA